MFFWTSGDEGMLLKFHDIHHPQDSVIFPSTNSTYSWATCIMLRAKKGSTVTHSATCQTVLCCERHPRHSCHNTPQDFSWAPPPNKSLYAMMLNNPLNALSRIVRQSCPAVSFPPSSLMSILTSMPFMNMCMWMSQHSLGGPKEHCYFISPFILPTPSQCLS